MSCWQHHTEDKVIEQMELFKNRTGITLVVFGGKHCVRGPVLRACEKLRSGGVRALLTAGSVETVVATRVLDWLLHPDEEPKVIHLRDTKGQSDRLQKTKCAFRKGEGVEWTTVPLKDLCWQSRILNLNTFL